VLSVAAVVSGLLSIYPWFYYYENLPSSPQPAVGRIYPVNMHGATKYATREQRRRLNLSEEAFFSCIAVLCLSGILVIDELGQKDRPKIKWPPPS
jgi:hypothetical protein